MSIRYVPHCFDNTNSFGFLYSVDISIMPYEYRIFLKKITMYLFWGIFYFDSAHSKVGHAYVYGPPDENNFVTKYRR